MIYRTRMRLRSTTTSYEKSSKIRRKEARRPPPVDAWLHRGSRLHRRPRGATSCTRFIADVALAPRPLRSRAQYFPTRAPRPTARRPASRWLVSIVLARCGGSNFAHAFWTICELPNSYVRRTCVYQPGTTAFLPPLLWRLVDSIQCNGIPLNTSLHRSLVLP